MGQADLDQGLPAGPDVQYRIGSITKTVTAAAVMQLVANGRLDLQGPLSQGWPDAPYPDISLADLLTHGSGLQREPAGAVWETLQFPERHQLLQAAAQAQRLYPQRSWFHYSNLGFALLGEMVAQMHDTSWEEYVQEGILQPLGLARTRGQPEEPAARGYAVEPYLDGVVQEPAVDCRGLAPAGQLWSTAEDLCRWTGVLSGCRPDVLDQTVLAEMRAPRTMADLEHWTWGFGLGLMLFRDGESVYVGHTGSMPGFLASVVCQPSTSLGVVVLANSTAGVRTGALAVQLLGMAREGRPETVAWSPADAPPDRIRPVLGRWWSEWNEWVFRWRDGQLQASPAEDRPDTTAARFVEVAEDQFVAVSGTERGERLVLVRGAGGDPIAIRKLYWATYAFTREPRASVAPPEHEAGTPI
ncbi:MAG TPA: serine hydrolase domain-containing protein [Candidatus Dormibacteraeota bacterium]|nr:serine hydrolase domain-containing protein [Candidatus Dormibacteraeota bacterium]